MAWRAWLPERTLRPWQAVVLALALAGVAAAFRRVLDLPLEGDVPFITYFPALIFAAALGGYWGGVTCLAASAILAGVAMEWAGASTVWAMASFLVSGGLVTVVAAGLADSVRQLRRSRADLTRAQSQLQTLVGELAHRSRNALFVIIAIVRQSARRAGSAAEAEQIINSRLEALVRAQDVIVQADGSAVALRPLVEQSLDPFNLDRFEIAASPDFEVDSDVAATLGLLFHEMATNAVKYGALSVPTGRVRIGWVPDPVGVCLTWRELGGPRVLAPRRKGFGSRLLASALVAQGGGAERRFEADGVVCELRIPGLPGGRAADRPVVAATPSVAVAGS